MSIAHATGAVVADTEMRTGVLGLFAAREAIAAPMAPTAFSGNAISKAVVFGRSAGPSPAVWARHAAMPAI